MGSTITNIGCERMCHCHVVIKQRALVSTIEGWTKYNMLSGVSTDINEGFLR